MEINKNKMLKVSRNDFNKWELLSRVLSEDISEDDVVFQSWLQESDENKELYKLLKGEVKEACGLDKDKVYGNLSEILLFNRKKHSVKMKQWFGYVALAFLLITSIAIVYDRMYGDSETGQSVTGQHSKNLFEPGTKKAYLLSSKGESIDLTGTFLIKKEDGIIISNDIQGVVSFERSDQNIKDVEYHTIFVPKGGEYELLLADGSKVFLNSETSMTFPSYFGGDKREVELTGEAFFEIEKNSKPFIVKTINMSIEVTGTSFNVSAYSEDLYANTTLMDGSVSVYAGDKQNLYYLDPGYNLCMNKTSREISVQKVDTDIYTAWVRGIFMFRNQPLHEILSQLSRWYDFTVEYDDPSIRNMKFTGSAEKARNLDYLLTLIESVTDIKYRNEENKIIMYK
ncbi:MAG: DUF4974 domain-containing protein [Tannerellaceae bacterium]|jgi:ferric-dicitrate binding protein FerR (iron transport regulator)|nr:DUF4974 domain-containing protein [Tannerellaceae bacterium]